MAVEPTSLARDFGVSKTVYSLVYPETREVVEELWDAGAFGNLSPDYEDADTQKQDAAHKPLLNGWVAWAPVKFDPALLVHSYPTNGSSEAIRDAIDEIAAGLSAQSIVVFEGEYEGYEAIARARGVDVIKIKREEWRFELHKIARIPPCHFFISQPSAIDGNLWPEFAEFMDYTRAVFPMMRIYLDLCYVGAVPHTYQIDATTSNIDKVFFSLSKTFGVYYHRIGGVYSRRAMPGLYGNMWFKNLFSINLGVNLMKRFGPYVLPQKYRDSQVQVVETLRMRIAKDIVPSDVVLLAHRPLPENPNAFDQFLQRGTSVRYCLMPSLKKNIHDPRRQQETAL